MTLVSAARRSESVAVLTFKAVGGLRCPNGTTQYMSRYGQLEYQ